MMDSYEFRRAVDAADQETENTVPVSVWIDGKLYDVKRVEYTELTVPRILITAVRTATG